MLSFTKGLWEGAFVLLDALVSSSM